MTEKELYDSYLKSYEEYVKSLKPLSFEELINNIPKPFRPILSLLKDYKDFKFEDYTSHNIMEYLFVIYGLEDLVEGWYTEFDPILFNPDFTVLNIEPLNDGDTGIRGPFQKLIKDLANIGIKVDFY